MQLTIDNLDGRGAIDYSAAVDRGSPGANPGANPLASPHTAGWGAHAASPLTIERVLNAPSRLRGVLCLEGTALPAPVRRARVTAVSEAGATLFTGYLATEPAEEYAGMASRGPVYRLAFTAVSDEWLLDKQSSGARVGPAFASSGGSVVGGLARRLDPGRLATGGLGSGRAVGVFEPQPEAVWSSHAGAVADATCAAYRALDGALTLTPAGSVVHAFGEGDGSLALAGLRASAVRELANDVTVTGALEPSVFWTELFSGDGVTAAFDLGGEPSAPGAGHALLLSDDFSGGAFDTQTWAVTDPGSHLALGGTGGASGLALSGGNGFDGQTTLTGYDAVELGGTLAVELSRVQLAAGSAGVLGGLYSGATLQANCFAGFSVRQSGGQTLVTALVQGVETGASLIVLDGHSYTLRLHLHCRELLRVRQNFYAMVDGGTGASAQQFGGGLGDAPVALVFEVRDLGVSSNTPVTVLFDGSVASSPAQAALVAVNSVQLFGSLGGVSVRRTGTAWIRSFDPTTGTPSTRLAGAAGQGLDCSVGSPGRVTFFAGRVPQPGERVTVTYRGQTRAVARLADPSSVAAEAAGGGVGSGRWLGHVLRPPARCSEDCESAAQAILSFSTSRAAALTGSYTVVNPVAGDGPDIWPGDLLALSTGSGSLRVLVRQVLIEDHGASPEALTWRIGFANDWAEGLGIHLSEAIASDARLPVRPLDLPPGSAAPVLADLAQLTVTGVTGSGASAALSVDAGTDPPPGGGFEVRRRDAGFNAGGSASGSGDLVLRSPVRGFSIPRSAAEETFFVRMYDATPLYSRRSSAIMTHLPLG